MSLVTVSQRVLVGSFAFYPYVQVVSIYSSIYRYMYIYTLLFKPFCNLHVPSSYSEAGGLGIGFKSCPVLVPQPRNRIILERESPVWSFVLLLYLCVYCSLFWFPGLWVFASSRVKYVVSVWFVVLGAQSYWPLLSKGMTSNERKSPGGSIPDAHTSPSHLKMCTYRKARCTKQVRWCAHKPGTRSY